MSERDPKMPKTLTDADIMSDRGSEEDEPIGRRSVLSVLGTMAATGAAGVAMTGCWPRVRYAGGARGTVVTPGVAFRSGVTDSDGGPYADPAGAGRGSRRSGNTGITDSDGGPYADPAGGGRGRVGYVSGVTDSDGGPYADPAGNGRGSRGGYSGVTDSDGGPYADPAGSGRGRWR